ncbi:MAG: hypothetical protein MUF07_05875 [Steroidobacteraceae bacterium]|jgi:hypothetical protein|nr:hypothetical protein [Steroidobacteraceae bacterium]
MRLAGCASLGATLLVGCATLPQRDALLSSPGPQAGLLAHAPVRDGRARFREIFCGLLDRQPADRYAGRSCADWLWQVDDEPPPEPRSLPGSDTRFRIFLVTGAFSECLGDEARPFHGATQALIEAGFRIETIVVSGRSGSASNADQIAERLAAAPQDEEGPIVLIGYSKGANDMLEFLVRYPELAARVDSAVSIAGAIRGSPLASQARGVYDALFGWIPSKSCPAGDRQVLDSLSTERRLDWLARNELPRSVRYFSLAAFTTREHLAAVLVPGWRFLLRYDLRNDGQLLARDALIPGSTLLGYLVADHWSAVLDVETLHPWLGARRDKTPFPRAALLEAILLRLADPQP